MDVVGIVTCIINVGNEIRKINEKVSANQKACESLTERITGIFGYIQQLKNEDTSYLKSLEEVKKVLDEAKEFMVKFVIKEETSCFFVKGAKMREWHHKIGLVRTSDVDSDTFCDLNKRLTLACQDLNLGIQVETMNILEDNKLDLIAMQNMVLILREEVRGNKDLSEKLRNAIPPLEDAVRNNLERSERIEEKSEEIKENTEKLIKEVERVRDIVDKIYSETTPKDRERRNEEVSGSQRSEKVENKIEDGEIIEEGELQPQVWSSRQAHLMAKNGQQLRDQYHAMIGVKSGLQNSRNGKGTKKLLADAIIELENRRTHLLDKNGQQLRDQYHAMIGVKSGLKNSRNGKGTKELLADAIIELENRQHKCS